MVIKSSVWKIGQSVPKIKIKQQWALLIISMRKKLFFLVLSLTFVSNTWTSHMTTNTHFKWEKFFTDAAAKLTSWLSWLCECLPCKPFWERPYGFSMVQECARATLASSDRTPLRSEQLPGWREYSEWTHGDRSWCGDPHPSQLSFPTLHHWFPGWVTLVTLSFNLLQRAWPLEHVSWGWEQSLGYWSPNRNSRCPQLVLRKTSPRSLFWIGKLLCFAREDP